VTGEWQTYTFNLSDLAMGGLDLSAIDVVMVFPTWGTGDGAVYRIDNVKFLAEAGDVTPPPAADSLTIFTDAENPR
jgi:hypothetical protein